MPRKGKFSSPVLNLAITAEQVDRAVQSASGACLIADAIKEQYPNLVHVSVDMATIRATDRKKGLRYTYLTTPTAQHVLLAFDQGWPNPADELTIKGAVKITPVTRGSNTPERREARRAELQARLDAGETLTRIERGALTKLARNPVRPSTTGRAEVGTHHGRITVRGGKPIVQGRAHPNLLRGQNRHFGAKMAEPGVAFREAVEQALAERLAEAQPS